MMGDDIEVATSDEAWIQKKIEVKNDVVVAVAGRDDVREVMAGGRQQQQVATLQ